MGAQAGIVDDLRLDGNLLTEHLDGLCPLQQVTAQRALTLVAHEHHRALGTPQVVFKMMADAARVAHTGGGDDDLGGSVLVQGLGLLHDRAGGIRHHL